MNNYEPKLTLRRLRIRVGVKNEIEGATGLEDRKREGLCPLSDRERVTECEKVNKLEGGQCHLAGKTAIISAI